MSETGKHRGWMIAAVVLAVLAAVMISSGAERPSFHGYGTSDLLSEPSDMSGYRFLNQSSSHHFVNASFASVGVLLESKGTGFIYAGYTGCEYCQRAVPVLEQLAENNDMEILYVNLEHEDTSGEAYQRFRELYRSCLFQGEDGELHPGTPLVIRVKDGKITGFQDGVSNEFYVSDEKAMLSKEQFQKLLNLYQSML